MKTLVYSILCEDKAHYAFITTFLEKISIQQNIQFEFNRDFFQRFRASNSKEVFKKYPYASILGFRDYFLDFLIVGIDYDDRDRKNFIGEMNKLYEKLVPDISEKCIFMFPVQAIEHWMLYIQYHQKHPSSTKNITFESIPRKEAKIKIYGNTYSQGHQSLVESLTNQMDTNWLLSRSESFRRFYQDFTNFLKKQ